MAGINLHPLARFTTVNSEFRGIYDSSACHKSFSCSVAPQILTKGEFSRVFHQCGPRLQA